MKYFENEDDFYNRPTLSTKDFIITGIVLVAMIVVGIVISL